MPTNGTAEQKYSLSLEQPARVVFNVDIVDIEYTTVFKNSIANAMHTAELTLTDAPKETVAELQKKLDDINAQIEQIEKDNK
jgi:peptidoglycan hydrolase CwlO-like protein